MMDPRMLTLLGVVTIALIAGSAIGELMRFTARSDRGRAFGDNLRSRMLSWWIMAAIFIISILIGGTTTVILFALSSFLAFREFITLSATRRGDHRALFWAFFVIIPLQYIFVARANHEMFTILIPVFAFLMIPARIAAAGDTGEFVGRMSRIQWGLMVCVYFVSHVPALLTLEIAGYDGSNAILLFFFILIVQMNDVMQYVVGSLIGRTPIAPTVSPNKTVEGMIGGVVSSAAIGAALAWATPFSVIPAACLAMAIAWMGFLGDIKMSAVKRDIGVKDYAATLPGHGGVLDRLDSLTFAAPLFFHVVRYFYVM
ncbi:MAG: phosphatidate cytidylyltransferase [Planctomycetota bacterium]